MESLEARSKRQAQGALLNPGQDARLAVQRQERCRAAVQGGGADCDRLLEPGFPGFFLIDFPDFFPGRFLALVDELISALANIVVCRTQTRKQTKQNSREVQVLLQDRIMAH